RHSSSAGPPKPSGRALSPPSNEAMASKPSRNETVAWRKGFPTRHPPSVGCVSPPAASTAAAVNSGCQYLELIQRRWGRSLPSRAGACRERGMQDEFNELGVVLGVGQALDQEIRGLGGAQGAQQLAQNEHGLQFP